MVLKSTLAVLVCFAAASFAGSAAAAEIAGSAADGDVTQLSAYSVPKERRELFESAARSAAEASREHGDNVWLTYEEHAGNGDQANARYFTVHFPHNIDELTEPATVVSGLVASAGSFRVHSELTRQVADWCSTTALDPHKLPYAFVEYLWLTPGNLEKAGSIMARRGQIMRTVYGTTSDHGIAKEGFVAMTAPFQVMQVLFSTQSTLDDSVETLRRDLEANDLLAEWDTLESELKSLVARRDSRAGRYRPALSNE